MKKDFSLAILCAAWVLVVWPIIAIAVSILPSQPVRYQVTQIDTPEARVMYRVVIVPELYPAGRERYEAVKTRKLIVEYPRNVPNKTRASSPVLIDDSGRAFCTPEGWGVLVAECEVAK